MLMMLPIASSGTLTNLDNAYAHDMADRDELEPHRSIRSLLLTLVMLLTRITSCICS